MTKIPKKIQKSEVYIEFEEMNQMIGGCDRMWLFLRHRDPKKTNYDLRWAIGYRKKDKWWGLISLFPATHESALDEIPLEVNLAKEAISLLQQSLSSLEEKK